VGGVHMEGEEAKGGEQCCQGDASLSNHPPLPATAEVLH